MTNKFLKLFIQKKIFITLVIIMYFFIPQKTNAATLSILPNTVNVSVGNTVTVKVIVNTLNEIINNAEGIIQFSSDMLTVTSISKSSSIFSLWVGEPSFSNSTGKITFNGGLPNPGFVGQNGNIISITFRAKKQGTASVIFIDGTVRANDGFGTDIMSNLNESVFYIKEAVPKPVTPKPEPIPTPTVEIPDPSLETPEIIFDTKDDTGFIVVKIGNNIFSTTSELLLFLVILVLLVVDLILHIYSFFLKKTKVINKYHKLR